ncbi:MAG: hypothetical protein J0653_08080, partial [Deltaproteobacteria bacterium]|nr:hypothetical protein [Deltaproteobacteria bacterium]
SEWASSVVGIGFIDISLRSAMIRSIHCGHTRLQQIANPAAISEIKRYAIVRVCLKKRLGEELK